MKISLVAADLTKWIAYGTCQVTGIWGFNQQGTDRYVLLFEKPTVAASDVPPVAALNFPASTSASYSSNMFEGGLTLSELFLAISTTPQMLTAPGAGGGLELTIEIETNYPVVTGLTTISGDLTTAVANRQVWASASGPKKLKRLDIINDTAAVVYAIVSASDTVLTTDTTASVHELAPNGATTSIAFGDGRIPFRKDGSTTYQGCSVFISSGPTMPFDIDGSADYKIRAIYE